MEKTIQGLVYVMGNDVDTDQIIPAHHLVYDLDNPEERKRYGQYALSGVPLEKAGLPNGFKPFIEKGFKSEFSIVIAGKNFGCGSSREHAPVALQMAGVQAVVAFSYARIFYRNAVDGGYLIPFECDENLYKEMSTGDSIEINENNNSLVNLDTGKSFQLKPLGEIAEIVHSGGLFEFAKAKGMI